MRHRRREASTERGARLTQVVESGGGGGRDLEQTWVDEGGEGGRRFVFLKGATGRLGLEHTGGR